MTVTFYAGKFNAAKGYTENVFTDSELTSGEWIPNPDNPNAEAEQDYIQVANPEYRPDLDINLSSVNAKEVARCLGYSIDHGAMPNVPIDEFIARVRQWLQTNIDRQSPAQRPGIDRQEGRVTMIDCGRSAGYLNKTIHRLAVMAAEGKKRGADVIYGA